MSDTSSKAILIVNRGAMLEASNKVVPDTSNKAILVVGGGAMPDTDRKVALVINGRIMLVASSKAVLIKDELLIAGNKAGLRPREDEGPVVLEGPVITIRAAIPMN